jgi:hypothetical protein
MVSSRSVGHDVDEMREGRKGDGSRWGPWGRRGHAGNGSERAAQEGEAEDVASWWCEVWPDAGVLHCDEREMGDNNSKCTGLRKTGKMEILV